MLVTLLRRAAVVPVVTLTTVADAVPLATVLRDAGMPLVEVTLRSAGALQAIREIASARLGITVAAGTVRTPADLEAAATAGATAFVSPGNSAALMDAATAMQLAWLPGVSTATEVMMLYEAGFAVQKLFPAHVAGPSWLAAMRGPFPDVQFVPTGGIDAHNMAEYLGQPNVAAAAGSWIAPPELISARAWTEIDARARGAVVLATRLRHLGMLNAPPA